MSSFFEELRRRNVFRVGVAYAVVAWLIIQVIETVSDPLGLPDWTEAFFIVLVLAGLPLILVFAWAFELTPEGLKKTRDVDASESVTAVTGKKLNYTIIVVLVLALGYTMWERQGLVERAEQTTADVAEAMPQDTGEASIAVLPFVNMSADPEQEFFSDGISEELLNLLAKIPELRVPARTSSFQFKGQNLDIGDVAEQLNVDHVLEGSVRKAGVTVRITAQLIEADSGYHLWSDTYDRELTDIFVIQDEISAAIVAALSERLGIQSSVAPRVADATDPDAYNAYLLAHHLVQQRNKLSIESAIANYEKALEIDPDYAPAHAGLGVAWYLLTAGGATYGALPQEESLAKAMPHIERALELDPELPEALAAYGLTLSAQGKDDEALPYFEKALELNPSATTVRNWYSNSLDELSRPDEALAQIEKAYELDPLSILTLHNYANHLIMRRRFEQAAPVLDRMTQIDPSRGAELRGIMEIMRGKAAAGTTIMLRSIDRDASKYQMRSMVAENLWNLELQDAARSLWPYPDNMYSLESSTTDRELALELALAEYAENPDRPGIKSGLAWAHYWAGEKEIALRFANEFLETLGEDVRPLNFTNVILALDARDRGDEEEMIARIEPLDASLDNALASGLETARLRFGKAWLSEMRGNSEVVLDNLEKAAFRGVVSPERLATWYKNNGWTGKPAFEDLRRRHRAYIETQRAELLATACGPDGFEIWQPSAGECGRTTAP